MKHTIDRRRTRIARATFPLVLAAAVSGLATVQATAAPPLLERLAGYRVVDASGRIAYRTAETTPGGGRIAYRPSYSPPYLLRARPYYIAGYAGTNYDNARGPRAILGAPVADTTPTTHRLSRLFHGFGSSD